MYAIESLHSRLQAVTKALEAEEKRLHGNEITLKALLEECKLRSAKKEAAEMAIEVALQYKNNFHIILIITKVFSNDQVGFQMIVQRETTDKAILETRKDIAEINLSSVGYKCIELCSQLEFKLKNVMKSVDESFGSMYETHSDCDIQQLDASIKALRYKYKIKLQREYQTKILREQDLCKLLQIEKEKFEALKSSIERMHQNTGQVARRGLLQEARDSKQENNETFSAYYENMTSHLQGSNDHYDELTEDFSFKYDQIIEESIVNSVQSNMQEVSLHTIIRVMQF
jgi:hypothetical protein